MGTSERTRRRRRAVVLKESVDLPRSEGADDGRENDVNMYICVCVCIHMYLQINRHICAHLHVDTFRGYMIYIYIYI
jgi:hypothetical protein